MDDCLQQLESETVLTMAGVEHLPDNLEAANEQAEVEILKQMDEAASRDAGEESRRCELCSRSWLTARYWLLMLAATGCCWLLLLGRC